MTDQLGGEEVRTDQLRRSLLVHCYRMLGSIRDAEDVVARAYSQQPEGSYGASPTAGSAQPGASYDGRSRQAWLYAEATQGCLARTSSGRRLPTDLTAPSGNPEGALAQRPEVLWLEPVPDDLISGADLGFSGRGIDLDFVAALQHLPPPQRAVLVLHDLSGWATSEVAGILDTSTTVVDGLLGTARGQFDPGPDRAVPARQEFLEQYARAFEEYDVPAIVELFDADAIWEMPPFTSWFRGAKNIGRLISTHCPAKGPGDQVLVPIKANGQPAFAVYMRDPVENVHRAFQIQVLTLTVTGIVHAVAFFDLTLFETFALPDLLSTLPDTATDHRPRLHIERDRHKGH